MKFRNNNKAVINKLTISILKADKIRNIFAIFSIILTTILFTSLFTIGGGINLKLKLILIFSLIKNGLQKQFLIF